MVAAAVRRRCGAAAVATVTAVAATVKVAEATVVTRRPAAKSRGLERRGRRR